VSINTGWDILYIARPGKNLNVPGVLTANQQARGRKDWRSKKRREGGKKTNARRSLQQERRRERTAPMPKCSDAVQYTKPSRGEFFLPKQNRKSEAESQYFANKLAQKLTILRLVSEEGKGGGREVEKAAICYLRNIDRRHKTINSQIVYKGFRVSKGHVVMRCVAGPKPIDKLLSC